MRNKDLFEYVAGPTQLDRAARVIRNTVLIRADSANGPNGKRRYTDTALKQIAAMAEGLPAYLNHVSKDQAFKPRDVKDLVGIHYNVQYRPTEGRIVSDLHVAEHHAPLVFGLAETAGGVIGNSLVSRGAVRMENDVEVVETILQLHSADLVSDPVTTKGLFESRERQSPDLDEAHERLRCAIEDRAYHAPVDRARHAVLAEAVRRGAPITDALAEGRDPLPKDIHARLAAAVRGQDYIALPADIHERLAAAITGESAVAAGIYECLARAVQR
jgi:hypothetical protein